MKKQEFMTYLLNNGIEEVEIYETKNTSSSLLAENNILEEIDVNNIRNYIIRVSKDNKTVSIKSSNLNEKLLPLLEEKLEFIENNKKEEFVSDLSTNNLIKTGEILDVSPYKDLVKEISRIKDKRIKHTFSNLIAINNYHNLSNSLGVNKSYMNKYYLFVYASYAGSDASTTSSYKELILEKPKEEILKSIKEEVDNDAILKLNKDNLKEGTYNALFMPEVMDEISSKIVKALRQDNVNELKTMYKDKLNMKEFSSKLNLIEDPKGDFINKFLFDEEGESTSKKYLIKEGVISAFISNKKEAVELKSTGNAFDATINVHNLYFEGGNKTTEEIIKSMDKGIIITSVQGPDEAISILNGNISLLGEGYMVENGEKKFFFENVNIATSISHLFNNVLEVSSDIIYKSSDILGNILYFKDVKIIS